MSDEVIPAEEKDLATHVQICAQRNREVAKTLTEIKRIQWMILAAMLGAGVVPWEQVMTVARAVARVP